MNLESSLKKLKLKPFWLFFIRSFNPAPQNWIYQELTQGFKTYKNSNSKNKVLYFLQSFLLKEYKNYVLYHTDFVKTKKSNSHTGKKEFQICILARRRKSSREILVHRRLIGIRTRTQRRCITALSVARIRIQFPADARKTWVFTLRVLIFVKNEWKAARSMGKKWINATRYRYNLTKKKLHI